MKQGDEVDEAQLHVVVGVVDLYLKLWGRIADVIRRAEEVGLPRWEEAEKFSFSNFTMITSLHKNIFELACS